MPSSVRSQSGNSNGENIYYVGSFAYGIDSGYSERIPLSYRGSAFLCPEGYNMLTYQLNFGAVAEVTVHYKVFVDP